MRMYVGVEVALGRGAHPVSANHAHAERTQPRCTPEGRGPASYGSTGRVASRGGAGEEESKNQSHSHRGTSATHVIIEPAARSLDPHGLDRRSSCMC
eukprot:1434810-Prymnesium_polylepis.1